MTTKVKVNMRLCSKTHNITVEMLEDGSFSCGIESDCVNVQEFAEGLETFALKDLIDKTNSKIWERYRNSRMSHNCLTPSGVLSAGWVEAGMISRNNAKVKKVNDVEFVFDE